MWAQNSSFVWARVGPVRNARHQHVIYWIRYLNYMFSSHWTNQLPHAIALWQQQKHPKKVCGVKWEPRRHRQLNPFAWKRRIISLSSSFSFFCMCVCVCAHGKTRTNPTKMYPIFVHVWYVHSVHIFYWILIEIQLVTFVWKIHKHVWHTHPHRHTAALQCQQRQLHQRRHQQRGLWEDDTATTIKTKIDSGNPFEYVFVFILINYTLWAYVE